jgi:hypothetical protein
VAVPVVAVGSVERGEVELVDDVEDEPGKMVLGEPVAQVGGQQEGLVAAPRRKLCIITILLFPAFAPNAPRRVASCLKGTDRSLTVSGAQTPQATVRDATATHPTTPSRSWSQPT